MDADADADASAPAAEAREARRGTGDASACRRAEAPARGRALGTFARDAANDETVVMAVGARGGVAQTRDPNPAIGPDNDGARRVEVLWSYSCGRQRKTRWCRTRAGTARGGEVPVDAARLTSSDAERPRPRLVSPATRPCADRERRHSARHLDRARDRTRDDASPDRHAHRAPAVGPSSTRRDGDRRGAAGGRHLESRGVRRSRQAQAIFERRAQPREQTRRHGVRPARSRPAPHHLSSWSPPFFSSDPDGSDRIRSEPISPSHLVSPPSFVPFSRAVSFRFSGPRSTTASRSPPSSSRRAPR